MALKKSELYSSLWQSCDELRGGMDASQYKDYILVLLFIKYVSDKYAGVPFAPITIPECLEFIVVHEMVHLLEPTHNVRIVALLEEYVPQWQHYRDMLNRLLVAHDEWDY